MPFELINIGTAPDSKTGDTLREGGRKINDFISALNDANFLGFVYVDEAQILDASVRHLAVNSSAIDKITLTLPSSPEQWTWLQVIVAYTANAGFTIDRNGKKINGTASNIDITETKSFVFVNDTIGWVTF